MHWKHVHVILNFLKNVKIISKLIEDVEEDSIDAQEDAWEKHADLVQKLNVQEKQLKLFAEQDMQEDAEEFTTEEKEDSIVEEKEEEKEEVKEKQRKQEKTVVVVDKKLSEKRLTSFAKRVAVKKCGKGEANKQCRQTVVDQVRQREVDFRRNAFKACACRTKLSQKCQNNLNSPRCARIYNRCARRCLRRACKARARTTCAASKSTDKFCVRRHARRCRRVHNRINYSTTTLIQVDEVNTEFQVDSAHQNTQVHNQIQSQSRLSKDVLETYSTERATEQCSTSKDTRTCITRVSTEIKTQEISFRLSAIKSCQCDATSADNSGDSTSTIVHSCVTECLINACNIRSTYECQSNADQTTCYKSSFERCQTLHLPQ